MASETLQIIVTATDNATGVLGKITSTFASMGKIAGGILLADSINKVSDSVSTLLSDGTNTLVFLERMNAAFTQMVAADLRAADATMTVADSIKHASGEAAVLSEWMTKLAIQSPFKTEDISKTFRIAKMYGFTARESQRLTQDMVDMASATGSSQFLLERLALAIGQIGNRGKLAGQEMRQLAEAGFPVGELLKVLAEQFHVTVPELQAMQEKGLIPAKTALLAITDIMEKNFKGAAKQQMNLLAGLISSFQDLREIGAARFMEGFLQPFKPQIVALIGQMASPEFFDAALRAGYLASGGLKAGLEIGGKIIRGIVDLFGEWPKKIGGFIKDTLSLIKMGVNPIQAILGGISNNFGSNAARIFGTIVSIISTAFVLIRTAIKQIFSGDIAGAVRTLFGDSIANAIIPPLQKIAGFVKQYILPLFGKLFNQAGGNTTAFVQSIFTAIAAFFLLNKAISGVSVAISVVQSAISGIGAIGSVISGIVSAVSATSIGGAITAAVASLGTAITGIFSGIAAAVGGFLATLSPVVVVIGAIVAALVLLGLAVTAVQNRTQIFSGIMSGLQFILGNVIVFFQFLWQALSTGILPAFGMILQVVGEMSVSFAEFVLQLAGFSGGVSDVGNALNWLGGVIKDSIINALQSAKVQLVMFLELMIRALDALGRDTSNLKSALNSLVNSSNMAVASGNKAGNAIGGIGSFAKNAGDEIAKLAGGLFNIAGLHLSAAEAAYEQASATKKLAMAMSALRVLGMSANEARNMFGNDWQKEVVKQAYGDGTLYGDEYLNGLTDGAANAIDKGKDKMKRVMDEVRRMVESALSPTEVTEQDQHRYDITKRISELQSQLEGAGRGRTAQINSEIDALRRESEALGPYQDKWDEFRRRVEAVATGTDIGQFGEKFRAQLSMVQGMFQNLNLDQIAAKFKDFSLFADKANLRKMLDMGVVDLSGIQGNIDQQIDAIIGKANLMKEAFDNVWANMSEAKKIDLANALGLDPETVASTAAGANQVFGAVTGAPVQTAQANLAGVGSNAKVMSDALASAGISVQKLPSDLTILNSSLKTFSDGLTKDVQKPTGMFQESMASIKASFGSLKTDIPETIAQVDKLPESLSKNTIPLSNFVKKLDEWVSANGEILDGIKLIEDELDKLAAKLAGIDLGPFQRHSPSPFEQSLMGSKQHLTDLLRLIPQIDFTKIRFQDFGLLQLNAESFANILLNLNKDLTKLGEDPTRWDSMQGNLNQALGVMNAIKASGAEIPDGFRVGLQSVIDDLVSLGKLTPDVAKQLKAEMDKGKSQASGAAASDAASSTDFTPIVKAIKELGTEIKTMFDGVMAHFDTIADMVANTFNRLMPTGLEDAWMGVARAIELAGIRLANLTIPDFLVHHSPSELELALWGTSNAMESIARMSSRVTFSNLENLNATANVLSNMNQSLHGMSEIGTMTPVYAIPQAMPTISAQTVPNQKDGDTYISIESIVLHDVQNPRDMFNKLKKDANKHRRMGD